MLKERFLLVVALVIPLNLAGCARTQVEKTPGPGNSVVPATLGALTGGEWRVTSLRVDGKEVVVGSEDRPTFAAEETGKIHGLATLNRYFGQMELGPGGSVRWAGPFGSTMMAGPENLMVQEGLYLRALQGTSQASLRDGTLVLQDAAGRNVIELRR